MEFERWQLIQQFNLREKQAQLERLLHCLLANQHLIQFQTSYM
jgi:hypothetical protein